MGLREWLTGLVRAVDAEYDRRIKRASQVVAYGHHGHDEGDHAEEEEAVIINVPRGTRVPTYQDTPQIHEDTEIMNKEDLS